MLATSSMPETPLGQPQLARHVGDPAPQRHPIAGRVQAEGADPAARGSEEAEQAADRRALAGPVGPQEPEDLATLDLEVDAPDRLDLAVVLDEALDTDDRVQHAHRSGSPTAATGASSTSAAAPIPGVSRRSST